VSSSSHWTGSATRASSQSSYLEASIQKCKTNSSACKSLKLGKLNPSSIEWNASLQTPPTQTYSKLYVWSQSSISITTSSEPWTKQATQSSSWVRDVPSTKLTRLPSRWQNLTFTSRISAAWWSTWTKKSTKSKFTSTMSPGTCSKTNPTSKN
jgi:hypothetical protein